MRNYDLRIEYIEDLLFSNRTQLENIITKENSEIKSELFFSGVKFIHDFNALFPDVSEEDRYKILKLLSKAYSRESKNGFHLIWSGPKVAGLPGRDTELVFEEMIRESRNSIILSIYSLSPYAGNLLNILKKKVQHGLFIEIYLDNFETKKDLLKELMSIKNNKLNIYEYRGALNDTQSLHAKVLTVDNKKSIITSSNLSYNGMDGNFELGVVLNSIDKAKEIRSVFNAMIKKSYFKRIGL